MLTNADNEKHVRETVRWFVDGGEAVANPAAYFPALHHIVFNMNTFTDVHLEKRIVKNRRRYRVRIGNGQTMPWRLGKQASDLYADAMEAIEKA